MGRMSLLTLFVKGVVFLSGLASVLSTDWSNVDNFQNIHSLNSLSHSNFDNFVPTKDVWGRRNIRLEANEIIDASSKSDGYRLPLEVIPFHYFLEIVPLLENDTVLGRQWTAPGNVKILVDAVKPESKITLHALFLNISEVQVMNRNNGEKVQVLSHNYSESQHDHYVIVLEKPLVVGEKYEIGVTFVAPISTNRADGLYRSHYEDPISNERTYLISTQMEFFHARQVFPCFDEPALKATFDIAIGRSWKHSSLSNSNLVSSVPLLGSFGWYIDSFNTTVVMPAYLVAFVVSDYKYAEADPSILKGRPVRVYGPEFMIDRGAGDYGVNVSAHVLSFYEQHFESEYPLPKMDSVAIPGFRHGAMENYGLNIYREVLLMDIPGVTTELQRSRVSNVIAHELAHQYFGNLVTSKWWDHVWLNEGFATYYSYIGQNAVNPEFKPMSHLLVESTQYAMILDSRERTSYPLVLDAKNPNDLETQAVGLPYYKGASLIRMMKGYLTPDTFEKGIKKYLNKLAYKPAGQEDLFEILTEQAYEDGTLPNTTTVTEIMEPWTRQRGYPLVRVISSDNDTLYVFYEKFQTPSLMRDNKHSAWPIPISIATEDNPDFENNVPKFWIPVGKVLQTYQHDLTKWIIINPDATGFYRVMYDRKLTQLLLKQFDTDHSVISPFSRSQILDDYFTLGSQMDIEISSALEFTKYFGNETEEISWIVFLKNIRRLFFFFSEVSLTNGSLALDPSPQFQGFKSYMVPRLEGVLKNIGPEQLPGERGATVSFRARLLNWACRLGSQVCMDYAQKLFELWKEKSSFNPVPVDLRDFMYCYGVAAGGTKNWLFAFERFTNETNLRQSLLLARSLGCVKDERVLKTFMESLIMGEAGLEKEDVALMFEGIISNPIGRPVVLEFLKTNLKTFKTHLNETSAPVIISIFRDLSLYLHTEEELMQVQNVIEENSDSLGNLRNYLTQYVSEISDNINWMSKYYKPMRLWFEKQTITITSN